MTAGTTNTVATNKDQRASWLALVVICSVATLVAALGFGALFAGAPVVLAVGHSSSQRESTSPSYVLASFSSNQGDQVISDSASGDQPAPAVASQPQQVNEADENGTESGKTFAGMITDSRCTARHSMKSNKTSAECARACVREGSRYVLVDGEEIHALEGDPSLLDRLAGVRVEVVGMLEGDTIRIKSVTAR
jgi:hypothetical protein